MEDINRKEAEDIYRRLDRNSDVNLNEKEEVISKIEESIQESKKNNKEDINSKDIQIELDQKQYKSVYKEADKIVESAKNENLSEIQKYQDANLDLEDGVVVGASSAVAVGAMIANSTEDVEKENIDSLLSKEETDIEVEGRKVEEVVERKELDEENLNESLLNESIQKNSIIMDKANSCAYVRGIKVSAKIKYRTKNGNPLPRYKNPKSKEYIEKLEKARSQGKEINGAYTLKQKQIEKEELELSKKNNIETQKIEGVEVPLDPMQAEKVGQELAEKASEAKIQMLEEQIKNKEITPDQDRFKEVVELERQSEVVTGAAIDSMGIENVNTEALNRIKEQENKVMQDVNKMESKATLEAEKAMEEVESIEEKIMQANTNLRLGEDGSKLYTEKIQNLQEEKKIALAKLSEKNPKKIGDNLSQNVENREYESAQLGDRHEEISKNILESKNLNMTSQIKDRNKDIEEKIEDKIESLDYTSKESIESQEKTREYLENQKTNYEDGSVGRLQYEAMIANNDINRMNDTRDNVLVNQSMGVEEKVSVGKMKEIEKYASENEKIGGLVKELSSHNKLSRVSKTPEIVEEVAKAQHNRDLAKESKNIDLEINEGGR